MTGPPRLLLGAALLFWGGMTERAVPGLACALLMEGAHWTRVRWDFKERSFLVGWRLSMQGVGIEALGRRPAGRLRDVAQARSASGGAGSVVGCQPAAKQRTYAGCTTTAAHLPHPPSRHQETHHVQPP